MLVGSYKYGDFTYGISAYDYGDALVMYLNSPLTKGVKEADRGIILDDGNTIPASWEYLYCSIGSGSITVSQRLTVEDGKKYKSQINEDFFGMLGSIIQGMRAGCKNDLLVNSDDLFNVSFSPMKIRKYQYDYDCDISLEMGIIRELNFVGTDGVEVHLEEDGSYSEKIYEMGAGYVKKKIKLDTSFFVDEAIDRKSVV